MTSTTTYPVWVANIKSRPRMRHDQVWSDITEVAAAAAGGIVAWCEIAVDAPDYRKAVLDLADLETFMPAQTDTPISWDAARFRLVDSGVDFGSLGLPGIAPTRHTSWVLLLDLVTDELVGVVGLHMIPGGWSPGNVARRPARRFLWGRHAARINARITDLQKRAARVHVAGDTNRPGPWVSFPGVRRSSDPGIMFVGSSGSVVQMLHPKHLKGLNTDHEPQGVSMVPRPPLKRRRPIKPPSPPYVGPAKFHGAADNKPISRIVIHATVSPCEPGGARSIGKYFREIVTRPSSANYVVDPAETVQVVFDSVEAYHAPPNLHSLGVELCDPMPTDKAGRPTNPERWSDANHEAMLIRAAHLVARLCLAYDVPVVRIDAEDLLAGRHGICGHIDVTNAWHQTTHTDPGPAFPWDHFMALVVADAGRLKQAHGWAA